MKAETIPTQGKCSSEDCTGPDTGFYVVGVNNSSRHGFCARECAVKAYARFGVTLEEIEEMRLARLADPEEAGDAALEKEEVTVSDAQEPQRKKGRREWPG